MSLLGGCEGVPEQTLKPAPERPKLVGAHRHVLAVRMPPMPDGDPPYLALSDPDRLRVGAENRVEITREAAPRARLETNDRALIAIRHGGDVHVPEPRPFAKLFAGQP